MNINFAEPRDLTRAAYQAAMLTAPSDQARARYAYALQWYERKWQAQDSARVQQQEPAKEEQKEAPPD